ncbi:MAG: hypothetical protein K2N94_03135 [Lachnospiraceae bacterium]|nr:hypothetical protein [Lachnospiraceae bacterium]
MKDYREVAESVLRRSRKEAEKRRKRERQLAVWTASAAAALALAAVIGVGVMYGKSSRGAADHEREAQGSSSLSGNDNLSGNNDLPGNDNLLGNDHLPDSDNLPDGDPSGHSPASDKASGNRDAAGSEEIFERDPSDSTNGAGNTADSVSVTPGTANEKNPITKAPDTAKEDDGPIWSDGEKSIYLRKKTNGYPAQEPGPDSAVFSPSGKKAELIPVEGWSFQALKVTLEDGTEKECKLTDVFFSSLNDFCWIGEERVVLEGHRNPSLNVYIVYHLEQNSFEEYYGLFFTWDGNYDKLYYVQPAPHFGAGPASEKIADQEETIYYKTEPGERLVDTLILDEKGEYIGFFVEADEAKRSFAILNCETMEILYEERNVNYNDAEIIVE